MGTHCFCSSLLATSVRLFLAHRFEVLSLSVSVSLSLCLSFSLVSHSLLRMFWMEARKAEWARKPLTAADVEAINRQKRFISDTYLLGCCVLFSVFVYSFESAFFGLWLYSRGYHKFIGANHRKSMVPLSCAIHFPFLGLFYVCGFIFHSLF